VGPPFHAADLDPVGLHRCGLSTGFFNEADRFLGSQGQNPAGRGRKNLSFSRRDWPAFRYYLLG
jgi:hypothetical protein